MKKIVNQAKHIVIEANRIKDIVDQEKGFVGGEFTLGIIPTIMPTLLPMFLKTFIKRYPKVNLIIKEQNTETLIQNLKEGHLDAAIAATPLDSDVIIERPLYYEPFVAYVPKTHRLGDKKALVPDDLDIDDVLLLRDGHCFRDGIINICHANKKYGEEHFSIQSGSFETLINLVDEGLGMTLLPYLNTLELPDHKKENLKHFQKPSPAREVSIIYHKSELKIQITNALKEVITAIVKSAITFQDVKIISPIATK